MITSDVRSFRSNFEHLITRPEQPVNPKMIIGLIL